MAAPDAGRHPSDGCLTLSLSAHVGFGSLPDQLIKESIKPGFCFNILCIGETGTGKSALINSLFNSKFEDPPSTQFLPSVQLRAQTYELQESNVLLKLTIVNTVGFGDQTNKGDSLQEAYEAKRHEFYLELQKPEEEIKHRFVQRVREKAAVLKEAEEQVQTKIECLMLMHLEEELKLEEKKKVLEDEVAKFIERKVIAELLQSQASVSIPVVSSERRTAKIPALRSTDDRRHNIGNFS